MFGTKKNKKGAGGNLNSTKAPSLPGSIHSIGSQDDVNGNSVLTTQQMFDNLSDSEVDRLFREMMVSCGKNYHSSMNKWIAAPFQNNVWVIAAHSIQPTLGFGNLTAEIQLCEDHSESFGLR